MVWGMIKGGQMALYNNPVGVDLSDANYAEITEDVYLKGATEVVTTASFLRVNRAYVLTAGSSGTNANFHFQSNLNKLKLMVQINWQSRSWLCLFYLLPPTMGWHQIKGGHVDMEQICCLSKQNDKLLIIHFILQCNL